MQTLNEWLVACGCFDTQEVTVTIGRKTYEGVRYKQRRDTGEEHESLYLLGSLPPAYQRSSRTAFVLDGEPHEWYVAMWVTPETASHPNFRNYHYDGNGAFMLKPWTFDERIDLFESTPYQRVKAAVKEPVAA